MRLTFLSALFHLRDNLTELFRPRIAPACFLILCSLFALPVQAGVLAQDQLIMPLSPSSPGPHLKLPITGAIDPNKPIWVAYQLIAVSAADEPVGKIVLEGSPEGVPVDIKDLKVVFLADKLQQTKSAGTIGTQLEAQVGKRTPQELAEVMGPELYAAYVALNEKRGAILQGIKVKKYGPMGNNEPLLLVSVEVAEGIQPLLVKVTAGQGDMPPDIQAAADSELSPSHLAWGALAIFLVLVWFRRRR
ncbi:MAG TPA: hypothetical protein VM553_00215 [Dongiaceae bacterium]|nr:hypothetical protein [Dongiaceae bacterium]